MGEVGVGEVGVGEVGGMDFRRVWNRFGAEGSFEFLSLREEISLDRIFPVSTASIRHSAIADSSASSRSWTRYSWERTSPAEPFAMVRKWMKSGVVSRSKPSAMLDITETAARRSWSRNPKSLARSPVSHTAYAAFASARAFCQARRSSNVRTMVSGKWKVEGGRGKVEGG